MKQKVLSSVLLFTLILSLLSAASPFLLSSAPQTQKPPAKDYMDRLLGRNTDPLGLKENEILNELLGQPQIKWVIRSEQRHILN